VGAIWCRLVVVSIIGVGKDGLNSQSGCGQL
jgi:hypothetical protein